MPGRLRRPLQRHYRAFASALKDAREQAGLTQRALADRLGVAKSVVDRAEAAERRVDVPELMLWCDALKTTPEKVIRDMRRNLDD